MKCWTKQNTNNNSYWQKKYKEKALKWTSQTGKEPYKNHSEKNSALQNTEKNNKTPLHRWNNSVERPWGILSLFTTCLQVQSPCHSLRHMWNTPQTAH